MKRRTKLLASLCLSAMAMTFLFGTQEKILPAEAIVVSEYDPEAKEGRPAYSPSDEYYETKQNISMDHVGNIESVWDSFKGDGIRVAVIDSGFDLDNPDFIDEQGNSMFSISEGRMFAHATAVTGQNATYTMDKTGATGTNDVVQFAPQAEGYGYKINDVWFTGNSILRPWAGYSKYSKHGTDVCSTLASRAHDTSHTGTIGIAPKVTIIPIKVDFWTDSIYKALNYIYNTLNKNSSTAIDVVNMSIEAPYYELVDTYVNNIVNQGTIVVAAAGNDNTSTASYPASSPKAIGVGALDRNSSTAKASFSNYNASGSTKTGNNNVDLVAPGYVYTASWNSSTNDHTYSETQGTSFSSPIVAGAAALWKQAHPSGTVDEFKTDLWNSCVDIGTSGWDTTFGYGRLAIDRLVDLGTNVTEVCVDSDKSLTLEVGDTSQIQAHVLPVTATDQGLVYELNNDNGVISVSNSGLITALKEGTESVFVWDHESHSYADIVEVTVTQKAVHPTSMSISPNSVSLNLATSETTTLSAVFTPSDTTDKSVLWDTEDKNIATIDEDGVVTPVGVGDTRAYCLSNDGLLEAYANINVYNQAPSVVTSVTISPGDGHCNVDLKNGNTIQLTATVNGTNLEDDRVTWSSLSSSYATVDQNGLVTCLKTGYADIKATSKQDMTISCTRRVIISDTTPKVTSISVSPTSKTLVLASSETVQLSANVVTTYSGSTEVTWETSNASIATVSNGLVTPHAVGTATITARSVLDTTKTATSTITVVQNTSVNYECTGAQTVVLKSGTPPTGSSVSFSNTYTNNYEQITNGNHQTWTFRGYEGYTITSIKLNIKRSSGGVGNLVVKNNNVTTSTVQIPNNSITNSYQYKEYCSSSFEVDGDLVFEINATGNSLYVKNIEITIDDSSLKEVDHITAIYNGSKVKYNTEIDRTNLEVRAYYDESDYDVVSSTKYELSGFNKLLEGEQTVTVSYKNKETTFDVTVVYYDLVYIELSNITASFNKGATFIKPTVTAYYEDDTSADVTSSATFSGYDMSTAGAYNVSVNYSEHNVTKSTSYGIVVKESGGEAEGGLIKFGSGTGCIPIDKGSVQATDSLSNSWTISVTGTSSYTQNADNSQVGSKKEPADTITLSMDLGSSMLVNSVNFKVGGNSGSAANVIIAVDGTTIGTGNVTESTTSTIESSSTKNGQTITITLTNIYRGICIYEISYNVGEQKTPTDLEKAQQFAVEFSNSVVCYGGEKAPTIVAGKTWATLTQSFNGLDGTVKAYFQVATPTDPAILDAVLKHDQLVSRYGYADFMGRSAYNGLLSNKINTLSDFNGITIVIIASIICLSALGGYIFIRKRKEQ